MIYYNIVKLWSCVIYIHLMQLLYILVQHLFNLVCYFTIGLQSCCGNVFNCTYNVLGCIYSSTIAVYRQNTALYNLSLCRLKKLLNFGENVFLVSVGSSTQ